MFMWLWFKGMPISSQELYERLKQEGVIVVSGHNFFVASKIIGSINTNAYALTMQPKIQSALLKV